jgi:hypothetical protein
MMGSGTFTPFDADGGFIVAEILNASTTIFGLDVSRFIGGRFSFSFQGSTITTGTPNGVFDLGSGSTASYTFRVPEPTSIVLSLCGMLGAALLIVRLRRQETQQAALAA